MHERCTQHHYHYPAVTMLTLPDIDGWYDAVLTWHCQGCRQPRRWAVGQVHQHWHGMTIAAWDAACAHERRTGSVWAQQAAQQERRIL